MRSRVQLARLIGPPETAIRVEGLARQGGQKLFEQSAAVDARFLEAKLVDKLLMRSARLHPHATHDLKPTLERGTETGQRREAIVRNVAAPDDRALPSAATVEE